MKLFVWTSLLCLLLGHGLGVNGLFFDELSQFFGVGGAEDGGATSTTSKPEVSDNLEVSLEHATDSFDRLWQQFRKELSNLMSTDDSDDDDVDVEKTTSSNLLQLKATTTTKPVSSSSSSSTTTIINGASTTPLGTSKL